MWQALMDWLPDLRVGTIEIRDLAGLIVGGLGAFLAYLAIRMGLEQGETAKRQAAIAEKQDEIMQEQLAKKSDLNIFLVGPDVREGHNVYPLLAMNGGSKSVNGFHYTVSVTDEPFVRVLEGKEGEELPSERYLSLEDWNKKSRHYAGFYQRPVFPVTPVQFATLIIDYTNVAPETDVHLEVYWIVVSEDGRIEGSSSDMFKDIKVEGVSAPPEMNGFHIRGSAVREKPQSQSS